MNHRPMPSEPLARDQHPPSRRCCLRGGILVREAPSQMLENWCWEPAALARMSRHHATGVPIPAPLMDALLRSRNANQGVLNMRQIVLGTFDQVAFSAPLARGLLLGFFGGFRSRKAHPRGRGVLARRDAFVSQQRISRLEPTEGCDHHRHPMRSAFGVNENAPGDPHTRGRRHGGRARARDGRADGRADDGRHEHGGELRPPRRRLRRAVLRLYVVRGVLGRHVRLALRGRGASSRERAGTDGSIAASRLKRQHRRASRPRGLVMFCAKVRISRHVIQHTKV